MAGSVVESIRPPAVETVEDPSTVVPSARRILTVPATVEAVTCTRAPRPAVPGNVILMFWPGMPVATVVAGPPAVTDDVTSGGTMKAESTMLPVLTPLAAALIL